MYPLDYSAKKMVPEPLRIILIARKTMWQSPRSGIKSRCQG